MIKMAFGPPRVAHGAQAPQHLVGHRHGVDGVILEHVRVDALGEDGDLAQHASDRDHRHTCDEEHAR